MAATADCIRAERDARRMLERQGLPQPDEVHYREADVLFLWHDSKVAVVIEVDAPPPPASP